MERDDTHRVPEATTRRLSLYLRVLIDLEAAGEKTVSSRGIADLCRLNPAQVRKDLSRFGGFGQRGVGYEVSELRTVVATLLGVDSESRVVIVGAGNLGQALADYPGFHGGGFEIVALFDVRDEVVGTRSRGGHPVHHAEELERIVQREDVRIGMVAVPAPQAAGVVRRLVASGVRGIVNFAPVRPDVPDGIAIRNVDLKVELESLSFFLRGLE
ncbi:MAG: redox-sensing transcriptional repressor Rex [Acidobacteria bacterium]|nr:redox-sensing transcriptional repressor Rex [Acidobacteriota bacterium]